MSPSFSTERTTREGVVDGNEVINGLVLTIVGNGMDRKTIMDMMVNHRLDINKPCNKIFFFTEMVLEYLLFVVLLCASTRA